jgi:hypothetical protein
MTNGFVPWWPGVDSLGNYTEFRSETVSPVGESRAHYANEAKITRSNGDEVIGVESSSSEPHIAA